MGGKVGNLPGSIQPWRAPEDPVTLCDESFPRRAAGSSAIRSNRNGVKPGIRESGQKKAPSGEGAFSWSRRRRRVRKALDGRQGNAAVEALAVVALEAVEVHRVREVARLG